MRLILFLVFVSAFCSCKQERYTSATASKAPLGKASVDYAENFELDIFDTYKVLTIKSPWPNSTKVLKYLLVTSDTLIKEIDEYDAVIKIPVQRMAVTSTTHIPSLEMLESEETLIGFTHLDYISAEKTRKRIDKGLISEIGKNEMLNTEVVINLNPDVVVGFAMDGMNSSLTTISNAGIPVLYNADWTEKSPLGKAEWIKFFGALLDKDARAKEIFDTVAQNYKKAKNLASKAEKTPTVLSGAMYQDVWYLPKGDSWAAQFIKDANGHYLWRDQKGTGSSALSPEAVLETGMEADVWIGPGQYTHFQDLSKDQKIYTLFKAYKTKEVYTYNLKKGATGGSIYFELAPNRPDLVLKDHIKILHPELLPDYSTYFFEKLR